MATRQLFAILPAVLIGISCSIADAQPGRLRAASETLDVRGEYVSVAIDRIDRLSLESGKLMLHGSASTMAVDLPAQADPSRVVRHWALVTESNSGSTRSLTFTHDQSLDDFTIELPSSDAEVKYGAFAARETAGEDVLIFAWGEGARSYWGHVTIGRRSTPAPASK